jgi:serine/threonine-protein kinase RsbW
MTGGRLALPATVESLAPFREFVRAGALEAGLVAEQLDQLDLILEEILINIARYAYASGNGVVEVRYSLFQARKLRVEIIDSGRAFNPLALDPQDLSRGLAERPIGGLGVFLVRSLVDSIVYRREQECNILSFTFPPATVSQNAQ